MFSSYSFAVDLAQRFQFEGQLFESDGVTPIASGSYPFEITIRNPSNSCILYRESHGGITVDAFGSFTIPVGTGTRDTAADGNQPWESIFSNAEVITGLVCGSYTPAFGDARNLYVTFNSQAIATPFVLAPVPMATNAQVSQKLIGGGVIPSGQSLFFNDTTAFSTEIRSPATLSSNIVLTLPSANGTSGQVLTTDGTGALSWTTVSGGGGITDLTGDILATGSGSVLVTIATSAVNSAKIADASIMAIDLAASSVDGSKIVDGSIETVDLAASAVTFANMQNLTAPARLMGRYSAGAGVIEEISIGSGLNLDGAGNLTALGGGDFNSDGTLPMVGALRLINGSTVGPALTFNSDPDTGIFSPAADEMGFSVGGVESLRIANGGNVGIGTNFPQETLHVTGSAKIDMVLKLQPQAGAPPCAGTPDHGSISINQSANHMLCVCTPVGWRATDGVAGCTGW